VIRIISTIRILVSFFMFDSLKKMLGGNPLGAFESRIPEISAFEPEFEKLSADELKRESDTLRARAKKGEAEDDLLPRAFALVREAAKRTSGQRPFDVQLIGGQALHEGAVVEMMTGEGKTLAAVAPAYLNGLTGRGVHVVTVNEYLARRDAVWMGQIYRALGLSVSCLVPNAAFLYDPSFSGEKNPHASAPDTPRESALLDKERDLTGSFLVQQEFLRPISRREAYLADITYGTNHEFGFDYLRDNLAYGLTDLVQRDHHFAIIDEVDSILIDEARTPLIIAAPDAESSEFYKTFARIVSHLEREKDFIVDEKLKSVAITDEGISKVEKIVGVQNLYAPEHLRLVHYLEECLRAKALFTRDKEYVVKGGEVIIVDEFTGRMLHGRRYSGGLHQAIEAKEGVPVNQESKTYAKISIQNYFRMYEKISGMTGTAQTSAEEFHKVYKLDVMTIPPNKSLARKDGGDRIYKNAMAKWKAVAEEIKERNKLGQPVLVGTTSIEKNEFLSALLSREGVPHEVLNAKNNEREGAIIAQAGRLHAVTIATNMAGRGVDIILGGNPPKEEESQKIRDVGGLHVVGTERHEARRIDNQLRGRAGRQGDPGSSQFFLSLEDDLLRIFGGDRMRSLMERFDMPEDTPLEFSFLSKAVAEAQAKVEGANFDMRKHLLEYDDVLNKQRTSVYKRRLEILESLHKDELARIIFEASAEHLEQLLAAEGEDADKELRRVLEEGVIITNDHPFPEHPERENLRELLTKRTVEIALDPQTLPRLLSILDTLWMSHLEDLEALSESVGLRAYGQRDPLVEYREEAHRLFKSFWGNFNGWIFSNIFRLAAEKSQTYADRTQTDAEGQRQSAFSPRESAPPSKVGRNDPCPCKSGKKYKKCHGS